MNFLQTLKVSKLYQVSNDVVTLLIPQVSGSILMAADK